MFYLVRDRIIIYAKCVKNILILFDKSTSNMTIIGRGMMLIENNLSPTG